MKKLSIFLFFALTIFSFQFLFSQYTDVINSNKPGFSESPYSVGKGVYQFENSIYLNKITNSPSFNNSNSFGFDLLFRTSLFFERLEINTQLNYNSESINYNNANNVSFSGLELFTIGAKYLIFEKDYKDKSKEVRSWKKKYSFDKSRLIPSVAIYVGLNTNFLEENYKLDKMSPKAGILLQNNFSSQFNLITNIFYNYIGTNFDEFSFIFSGTYNYNERWSSFIETQSIVQKNGTNFNLGLGLAYLINSNLQINSSARLLSEQNDKGYYLNLGLSYRINKHKDSFKMLDENGNEIKDTPIEKYNKKQDGFFNRLFSIFTKNDTNKKTRKRVKRKRKN